MTRRRSTARVDLATIVQPDAPSSERVAALYEAGRRSLSEFNAQRMAVSGNPDRGLSPSILVELADRAVVILTAWADAVAVDADCQIKVGVDEAAEAERRREIERDERRIARAAEDERRAVIEAEKGPDDGLTTIWFGNARDI